jgi:hypothetical protein
MNTKGSKSNLKAKSPAWVITWYDNLIAQKLLDDVNIFNINKRILAARTKQQQKYYIKLIVELASTCSTTDQKKFVELLLTNELHYINTCCCNLDKKQEFLLKISAFVAKELYSLSNIVGVQPITAPVGLVYRLVYKDSNENNNTPINQFQLEIIKDTTSAISRKLQACVSIEAMQDCTVLHDIDFEKEIAFIIAQEISYEIVKKIVDDIETIAANNIINIKHRAGDLQPAHANAVINAIMQQANKIIRDTHRGVGNFIICTANSAVTLKTYLSLSNIYTWCDEGKETSCFKIIHIKLCDTIAFKVYIHNFSQDETIDRFIIGYKGESGEVDTGYIFSPYILVGTSGITINTNTFLPQMEFITRFGTHVNINTDQIHNSKNYYRIVDADPLNACNQLIN